MLRCDKVTFHTVGSGLFSVSQIMTHPVAQCVCVMTMRRGRHKLMVSTETCDTWLSTSSSTDNSSRHLTYITKCASKITTVSVNIDPLFHAMGIRTVCSGNILCLGKMMTGVTSSPPALQQQTSVTVSVSRLIQYLLLATITLVTFLGQLTARIRPRCRHDVVGSSSPSAPV